MINEKFVILGALINLGGTIGYVRATLSGRAKPNRVTWFMWALAPLIAFAAELDQHVGLIALMTFMTGFGPLLVLGASFANKNAYWKLTSFDYICGGLSLMGLALWMITKQGNTAILFAILADTMAAVPTIIKAYKNPGTEYPLAFGLAAISAVIALLSIQTWTFANWGFPLYILIVCTTVVAIIKIRTQKNHQP